MTTTANRATADQLLAAADEASRGMRAVAHGKPADEASRGMRAVADGKPADQPTHSDARSFLGIANLLHLLARELDAQRALATHRGDALARIADLKVRGGAGLIERSDWRKVAAELRDIAGETLANEVGARS